MKRTITLVSLASLLTIWLPTASAQTTEVGPSIPVKPASVKKIEPLKPTKLAEIQPVSQPEPAPAPQPAQYSTPAVNAAPTASGVVSGCGDNFYANYIYIRESGCRLNATNPGGCVGIGQACPGSKLYAVCPDLNYACQNSFFTSYSAKYGGWYGSYQFWLAHSWW